MLRNRDRVAARRGSVAQLALVSYLPLLVGFVSGPLMARALGPVGRGEVAAILVYATVLPFLYQGGLNAAILHFAAADPEARPALFGSAIRWTLGVIPLSVAVAAVLLLGPLDELPNSVRIVGFVVLSTSWLATLASLADAFLAAEGALGPVMIVQSLAILGAGFAVVLLYVAHRLTPVAYLIAVLVTSMPSAVLTISLARVRPRGVFPFRKLVGFSARAFPAAAAGLANTRLDQMLVAPIIGVRPLGLYAVAVTIATLPLSFVQALGRRAYGAMAADTDAALDVAALYIRRALVVALLACLALVATVPFLVPLLYGTDFEGTVRPLLFLLPGTAALSINTITRPALILRGRPGVASIGEGVALAITAAGLLVLLPVLGITGAAIVSSVSYWANIAIQLMVLRRHGLTGVAPRREDARWLLGRLVQMLPGRAPAVQPARPMG